jgi:hypothetical protein
MLSSVHLHVIQAYPPLNSDEINNVFNCALGNKIIFDIKCNFLFIFFFCNSPRCCVLMIMSALECNGYFLFYNICS